MALAGMGGWCEAGGTGVKAACAGWGGGTGWLGCGGLQCSGLGLQAAGPLQPWQPTRRDRGNSEGETGNSPPSPGPKEEYRRGDVGLAIAGLAAPIRELREKGSECLKLFGAEGNELKTMSSSVNIYQMNESKGLKR